MCKQKEYYGACQELLEKGQAVRVDTEVATGTLIIYKGDAVVVRDDYMGVQFLPDNLRNIDDALKYINSKDSIEKVILQKRTNGAIAVYIRGEDFGIFEQPSNSEPYCYFPKKHDKLSGDDYIAVGEALNKFNGEKDL